MELCAQARYLAVAGAALLTACATVIEPREATIRPSEVPLGSFSAYTLAPLAVGRTSGAPSDELAVTQIETELRGCLRATFRNLREESTDARSPDRRLIVEPEIIGLRKVNATERRWIGPFAGSSAVVLKLALRDSATGRVIAAPVFHARAGAWEGSFAPFAATDDAVLGEVVARACTYARQNLYDQNVAQPQVPVENSPVSP